MKIGRGGVEPSFDPHGFAGRVGLFQLGAEIRLADDFRRAFLDVGELFVNWGKGRHAI
jgi:hypothetical protein